MLPDLRKYDVICVSTSGGKDSQATLSHVVEAAEDYGVRDRVIAVHSDLGHLVWPGEEELTREQCELLDVPYFVVSRIGTISEGRFRKPNVIPLYEKGEPRGDLLDQVERRYHQLQAIGKDKPPWFSPAIRYCTSDFKRGPIQRFFTEYGRRWNEKHPGEICTLLDIQGLRAEESPGRGKRAWLEMGKVTPNVITEICLPIQSWKQAQVWEEIERSGLPYHWVYDVGYERGESLAAQTSVGIPRLSCCFCCFAPKEVFVVAASVADPELLRRHIDIEEKTGFTFMPKWSMREVAEAAQDEGLVETILRAGMGGGEWNMNPVSYEGFDIDPDWRSTSYDCEP